MMRLAVAVAALVGFALPAVAAPSTFREIRAGEPLTIAADRAYLLIRCKADCVPLILVRVPTPAETQEFDQGKRAAFVKAGSKGDYAAFAYQPKTLNNVYLPDHRAYFEDGPTRSFLIESYPGTYIIYGIGSKAVFETCFCLGTVKAEASAGTVTDLGSSMVARAADPAPFHELADLTNKGDSFRMDFPLVVGAVRPASPADPVPQALRRVKVVPAHYQAVGPFDEPSARGVSHLPAISGVLDYRRGEVVDVPTGSVLRGFAGE
jgi:hypothetical protein